MGYLGLFWSWLSTSWWNFGFSFSILYGRSNNPAAFKHSLVLPVLIHFTSPLLWSSRVGGLEVGLSSVPVASRRDVDVWDWIGSGLFDSEWNEIMRWVPARYVSLKRPI